MSLRMNAGRIHDQMLEVDVGRTYIFPMHDSSRPLLVQRQTVLLANGESHLISDAQPSFKRLQQVILFRAMRACG